VIDAETNLLIETVPQSQNSHSVAVDSKRNRIFVPQVAPFAVVQAGGDTTPVGAGICGSNNAVSPFMCIMSTATATTTMTGTIERGDR